MKSRKKKRSKPLGQSLVEFTLMLPILLIVISGLIEFGFLLNFYLDLVDTTREVARLASDDDPGHARISLAFGALMALIEKDGILELEPYLQPIADILMEHIDQSIRSRSKRASDDEAPLTRGSR